MRAAVVNAGNANAETGEQGLADAWAMCAEAGSRLGLAPELVAVAETGMIGVPLPIDAVLGGIAEAAAGLSDDRRHELLGGDHDHRPLAEELHPAGGGRHPLRPGQGRRDDACPASRRCSASCRPTPSSTTPTRRCERRSSASFERITVDGQMSTNDTVLLQATGAAGAPLPEGLLEAVLLQLAIEIIARRRGRRPGRPRRRRGRRLRRGGRAGRAGDRQLAAGQDRALRARPQLGPDRAGRRDGPGRRGPRRDRRRLDRRDRARRRRSPRPRSACASTAARHSAHVWFSDLSYEYVRINAEYTT